jgi:hypothetical protein
VNAIVWTDINNGKSFIKYGGLLDYDNEPKQSFDALKNLINNWTTRIIQGMTNEAGIFRFKGFGGKYNITVTKNHVSKNFTVHLNEQTTTKYTLQLDIELEPDLQLIELTFHQR